MTRFLSIATVLTVVLHGAAVEPVVAAGPAVSITLGPRQGRVTPTRQGCARTGGGNIDVAQPSPDTIVVTLSGVAVATGAPGCPAFAAMDFDVDQCFEVVFEKKDLKAARLTIEARVIGLLRSHSCFKKNGSAEESGACATVLADQLALVTVSAPGHSVAAGENLSINDRDGPHAAPIGPGRYTLHQTWRVSAQHPGCIVPCKAASAEFAPDPALDPLWIDHKEPFHGAQKKDLGFQVTIRVAAE